MSGNTFTLNDIEELTDVLEQRERLEAVQKFLREHDADDDMLSRTQLEPSSIV